MNSQDWDEISISFTKAEMDRRLKECSSYRGWEHTIRLIVKSGLRFDKLHVAEVGCGSGTFSLTLALLGAQVTLVDFNKNTLERAKEIYALYGCLAETIEADCLQAPAETPEVGDDRFLPVARPPYPGGLHQARHGACAACRRTVRGRGRGR